MSKKYQKSIHPPSGMKNARRGCLQEKKKNTDQLNCSTRRVKPAATRLLSTRWPRREAVEAATRPSVCCRWGQRPGAKLPKEQQEKNSPLARKTPEGVVSRKKKKNTDQLNCNTRRVKPAATRLLCLLSLRPATGSSPPFVCCRRKPKSSRSSVCCRSEDNVKISQMF